MDYSQLHSYGVLFASSQNGFRTNLKFNRLQPLQPCSQSSPLAPDAWNPITTCVCQPPLPVEYRERNVPVNTREIDSKRLFCR
tara:strand:- start:140 stop:388 length:249 start_codon:yes stop_codon:yes gene_type:complete